MHTLLLFFFFLHLADSFERWHAHYFAQSHNFYVGAPEMAGKLRQVRLEMNVFPSRNLHDESHTMFPTSPFRSVFALISRSQSLSLISPTASLYPVTTFSFHICLSLFTPFSFLNTSFSSAPSVFCQLPSVTFSSLGANLVSRVFPPNGNSSLCV